MSKKTANKKETKTRVQALKSMAGMYCSYRKGQIYNVTHQAAKRYVEAGLMRFVGKNDG